MINFERLPKVNFYGSSFAGGASGYPLMFDNYKVEEQIKSGINRFYVWYRNKYRFLAYRVP